MGAKRTEYQIVGRYMNGKEVAAYHLQSIETGKAGRYSREQVAYLVGRNQITNCIGQIYQDKLLLRGKGMSLEDLPIQQENGELKVTDNIGKVRRCTSASDAMEQLMIVGKIKAGRDTVGYVIQNAGCGLKRVKRQQVIELAKAGKIGNARVQNYQGNELLKGVRCNLDELPAQVLDEASQTNQQANNIIMDKHKEIVRNINNLVVNLPEQMTLKKNTNNNAKEWVYSEGSLHYTIMDNKGGAMIVWSAANGLEGGGNTYDNIVDEFSLAKYFIEEAIGVIRSIQDGTYKPIKTRR